MRGKGYGAAMAERIYELHEREDEIVAAYRGGQDAERVARRYGLTAAEVEHIVDRLTPAPRGLQVGGNRVLIAVAIGFLVGLGFKFGADVDVVVQLAVWAVAGGVAYGILTSVAPERIRR